MKRNKKYTYEEVKEYLENLGYILLDSIYKNVSTNMTFKDNEGFYYYSCLQNIQQGCTPAKFRKSNIYIIHNIKLWCILNNKQFRLLDGQQYTNDVKKLKWQCLKPNCGEIFEASWNKILHNRGCGVCHGFQVGLSNCLATRNPQLASEWHPTKNGDLTPYDVTYGSDKEVWWQCEKGHEWKAIITNRNHFNQNCPYCAGKLPSKENNLLINNPVLCEEWDYSKNKLKPEDYTPNSAKKVWWKCKKCGYQWKTSVGTRNNRGCGCPQCNESKGEKQLDIILTQYNIPHDKQYSFNDLKGMCGGLLKFDIPVFWDKEKTKLRMLIEYDGIFHYEKQYDDDGFETLQIHDELKNEYCKNNNVKLLRIPYCDFDNIEEILKRELIL